MWTNLHTSVILTKSQKFFRLGFWGFRVIRQNGLSLIQNPKTPMVVKKNPHNTKNIIIIFVNNARKVKSDLRANIGE